MSAKTKGGRGHRGILDDVRQWRRMGCSEIEIRENLKQKGYRLARISQLMNGSRSLDIPMPERDEPPSARSAESASEDPRCGAKDPQSIKRKANEINDEIEESASEDNEEGVYAKWSLDGAKFVQREIAVFLNNCESAECTLPQLKIVVNAIPPQILAMIKLDGVPMKLENVQRCAEKGQMKLILQKLNEVIANVTEFFESRCSVGAPTSADAKPKFV